jgi:hypothetical protein
MSIFDWSRCPAVESVSGRLSGAWVFRNNRMPSPPYLKILKPEPQSTRCLSSRRAALTRQLPPLPASPSSTLTLFKHVTPNGIARSRVGHTVIRAKGLSWDVLSNGDSLAAAEPADFDASVTADET